MPFKDFEIISKLGQGAYSIVYKVKRLEDGQIYALKKVKLATMAIKEKQNAITEIRVLASIKHPNVIAYRQAFVDDSIKSLCIVMEYANNGDIAQQIKQHIENKTSFSEDRVWNIFIDLVKGLKQMHDLQILHRDIKVNETLQKSANVFLHDEVAKLGDMNVSKISEQGLCATQTGTPYYASPEVWKDQPYDGKSDIWSLGCVLYEIIMLAPPFVAEDMEGLYKKVTRGIYPKISPSYSQDLGSMIRSLLQVTPESRPSCQKILKMTSIQKKLKNKDPELHIKSELLKTIKMSDNYQIINQHLPKASYSVVKNKRNKAAKSIIEAMDEREKRFVSQEALIEVQSLPFLEKDKKLYAVENSDRVMTKDKINITIMARDRKKSQISYSRPNLQASEGLSLKVDEAKQLKLPKVQSRYNRSKQKSMKQNSLRTYKIYE